MKTILFILVSVVALTSTLGGLLMISKPDGSIIGLPLSLLDGTPFKNFLVPGIILVTIVGGVNLTAIFYFMQRDARQYNWAIAGGLIISGWIIVQMIMIHAAHWLHFIYLGIGVLIMLIAYQKKGKWAV